MSLFSPKTTDFIHLLKEVAVEIKAIAAIYKDFAGDFGRIDELTKMADEIEHKADQKVHDVINALHKTFITPFDREDIYALAHQMDDLVDIVENVIHNVSLYQIERPRPEMGKFAELIVKAAEALEHAVGCLEDKNPEKVKEYLLLIHKLEDEGDVVFFEAIKDLFKNEHDPIALIKWKDIIEELESVMDKFQEVSNIMEGMIVKAS